MEEKNLSIHWLDQSVEKISSENLIPNSLVKLEEAVNEHDWEHPLELLLVRIASIQGLGSVSFQVTDMIPDEVLEDPVTRFPAMIDNFTEDVLHKKPGLNWTNEAFTDSFAGWVLVMEGLSSEQPEIPLRNVAFHSFIRNFYTVTRYQGESTAQEGWVWMEGGRDTHPMYDALRRFNELSFYLKARIGLLGKRLT